MKTVLITGIGGDIGQSIAMIIREDRPDIRLIGIDMNLQHAGSLFVDEVLKVPAALSRLYLDRVREIISTYSIDTVIPTSESELAVFTPLIDELGENRCISAGKYIISTGLDKLKTMNFISSLGIQIPWTIAAENELPSEFPCIFKAQNGSGSKSIFVVTNREESHFYANKFPNSIFQELLEPDDKEVTCAVYRRRDGKISVLQLLRRLTGGLTGWAKVINDDKILKMCETIANCMDLRGSINIQLRVTESGPRIFEINPRFSSTVLMRHRIGFCDLLWSLDEAKGIVVDFPDIAINQCMVRVQDTKKIHNIKKYEDRQ